MGAISSRFAVAIHILAYLAWRRESVASSSEIARSVNTNPVVVRRIISALREAGLVEVLQGVDGGARLARQPCETSLLEVYQAVEHAPLFSHHPQTPNAGCQVGGFIQATLGEVFVRAENAMRSVLASSSVQDVFVGVQSRGGCTEGKKGTCASGITQVERACSDATQGDDTSASPHLEAVVR